MPKTPQAKSVGGLLEIDPKTINIIPFYNVRPPFDPKHDQKDKELFNSMSLRGYERDKPCVVRWNGSSYDLIAGHRRVDCAMQLGVKYIYAVLEGTGENGAPRTDAERIADLIVSNSGKPLQGIEQGAAFARLLKLGWKQTEIAERFSVTARWVLEMVKAARLDDRLKELIRHDVVSATVALETVAQVGTEKAVAGIKKAAATAKPNARTGVRKATSAAIAKAAGTKPKNTPRSAPAMESAPLPVISRGEQLPQNVLSGPFTRGKGETDCTVFEADGTELCDGTNVEKARAMILLLNQGWHRFAGNLVTSPAPVAANDTAKAPAKRAAAQATRKPARKRA